MSANLERLEKAIRAKLVEVLAEAQHDLAAVRASTKAGPEIPLAAQIAACLAKGDTPAPLPAALAASAYAAIGGHLDASITVCKAALSGRPSFRMGA